MNNSMYRIPNRIFVGGIPQSASQDELRDYFSHFGHVKDARIISDQRGNSRGYGFVTYDNETDACKVLSLKEEELVFKDNRLNIGHAFRKKNFNNGNGNNGLQQQSVGLGHHHHNANGHMGGGGGGASGFGGLGSTTNQFMSGAGGHQGSAGSQYMSSMGQTGLGSLQQHQQSQLGQASIGSIGSMGGYLDPQQIHAAAMQVGSTSGYGNGLGLPAGLNGHLGMSGAAAAGLNGHLGHMGAMNGMNTLSGINMN